MRVTPTIIRIAIRDRAIPVKNILSVSLLVGSRVIESMGMLTGQKDTRSLQQENPSTNQSERTINFLSSWSGGYGIVLGGETGLISSTWALTDIVSYDGACGGYLLC